jgi:hypothetical protein
MSIDEARMPGAVRRVAIAVTHGDAPVIVAASDDTVSTRAVALHLVADTDPRSISPGAVAAIREALLEERWSDAVWEWMDATGEVLDAYPDEPVWSEQQLDEERVALELRMALIFRD